MENISVDAIKVYQEGNRAEDLKEDADLESEFIEPPALSDLPELPPLEGIDWEHNVYYDGEKPPARKNEDERHGWILAYYHKSGHSLVHALAKSFHIKQFTYGGLKKKATLKKLNFVKNSDFFMFDGSFFDFQELSKQTPQARFIHFARNPYEMVLSGFRYHKALSESWCGRPSFYRKYIVCQKYESWTPVARKVAAAINVTKEEIDKVHDLCVELYDKSSLLLNDAGRSASYGHALDALHRSKSPMDGIFLEAARSMIGWDRPSGGGDMLRMGKDGKESNLIPQTLRMFMEDYTTSSKDFNENIACFIQFIGLKDAGVNEDQVASYMSKLADLHAGAKVTDGKKHLTSTKHEQEIKDQISALKSHPVLNPILEKVYYHLYRFDKSHFCKNHIERSKHN